MSEQLCRDAFGVELKPGDVVAYAEHRGHSGVYLRKRTVARLTEKRVYLHRNHDAFSWEPEHLGTVSNRVVRLSGPEGA